MQKIDTSAKIFNELTRLEKDLQQLKIKAYFALDEKDRKRKAYREEDIVRAVRSAREGIWQKRYAKKAARVR
jgi:hypothetical protein